VGFQSVIATLETLNLKLETRPTMKRRSFLTSAAAFGASPLFANNTPIHTPKGKAEHCIFIWLGGGMGQIDTFDPKKLGNNIDKPNGRRLALQVHRHRRAGCQVTEHLARPPRSWSTSP
jgi:hypothetical protein